MRLKRYIFLLFVASLAMGEVESGTEVESASEPPVKALPTESSVFTNVPPPVQPVTLVPTLQVSTRIETAFSGGSSVQQGFSIPSARLTVQGEVGDWINYRFSMGQTREFSTALLPQFLPTEAYIDLTNQDVGSHRGNFPNERAWIRVRLGLFAPQFNPWWTPDLSDIRFPDYHEVHKALFLSREMGIEATVAPLKDERLQVSLGYVNGSGVFSLNTNNAKAFTTSIQSTIPLNEGCKLRVGTGAYLFSQSMEGAINYRSSKVVDIFSEVDFSLIVLRAEVILSRFEDSTRLLLPKGGAGSVHVRLTDWISIFARFEQVSNSPQLLGRVQHIQAGPLFDLGPGVSSYFTFTRLEAGGSRENFALVRFRLSV